MDSVLKTREEGRLLGRLANLPAWHRSDNWRYEKAEKDGPGGLFTIGMVLYALPHKGLFKVMEGDNVYTAWAVSMSGGSLTGMKFAPAYAPGARVVLYHRRHQDHPGLFEHVILGFLPVERLVNFNTMGGGLRMRHKYDAPPRMTLSDLKSHGTRAFEGTAWQTDHDMRHDVSLGKPLDASPGDFTVANALGGGLLLSDFMSMLKASDSAKLEMFLADSKVRITSDNFVHVGLCHDLKSLEAFGGSNSCESFGFTPFDLLGLSPGVTLSEGSESNMKDFRLYLDPSKKPSRHKPLPRVSRMVGPVFDGLHYQVMAAGLTGTESAKDSRAAAVGALVMRLDGVSRLMGAREASLVRTVRIPAYIESDFSEEVGEFKGVTKDAAGKELQPSDPAYVAPPDALRLAPPEMLFRAAAASYDASYDTVPAGSPWDYEAGDPAEVSDASDDADDSGDRAYGIGYLPEAEALTDGEKAREVSSIDQSYGASYATISENADLSARLLAELNSKWRPLSTPEAILAEMEGLTTAPVPGPDGAATADPGSESGKFVKFLRLPPLADSEQEYGESQQVRSMLGPFPDFARVSASKSEPKIPVEDGGGKFRIYGNSCGVRCLDDGTVVISGGFGEELRMHRGNIYITCPGNIYAQPGKDFVAMAPRNAVVKAAEGVAELTSGGMVNIAGGNDVSVVSGMAGGHGALILESKSKEGLPTAAERWAAVGAQSRKARMAASGGGGVVVRSRTDAAVVSSRLLVDGPSPSAKASVELFADKLITHAHRSLHYLDASGVMSVISKDGTSCSLTSLGLALSAPWTSIMTNQVDIYGKTLNTAWLTRDDAGAPRHETVTLTTADNPPVLINGTLTARTVVNAAGAGLDSLDDFFSEKRTFATEAGLDLSDELSKPAGSTPLDLGSLPSAASSGAWAMSALFPCSRVYGTLTTVFREAMWQTVLTESRTWSEPQMLLHGSLLGHSMAWPGHDAWNDPLSYQYLKVDKGAWGGGTGPLRACYRVNAAVERAG